MVVFKWRHAICTLTHLHLFTSFPRKEINRRYISVKFGTSLTKTAILRHLCAYFFAQIVKTADAKTSNNKDSLKLQTKTFQKYDKVIIAFYLRALSKWKNAFLNDFLFDNWKYANTQDRLRTIFSLTWRKFSFERRLDQWFSTAGTRPGTETWRPFHP